MMCSFFPCCHTRYCGMIRSAQDGGKPALQRSTDICKDETYGCYGQTQRHH
jgi:hypothetical protein